MIALVPPAFFRAVSGIEGSGLDSLVSSEVVTASSRSPIPSSSTACSVCCGLPEEASATRKPRSFSSRTRSAAPGRGSDLGAQRLVLVQPALAQVVAVALLDLVAGDGGDELVAAHADGAVDLPQRHVDVEAAEGPRPREGVVVGGVDQGAVDVEQDGVVTWAHAGALPTGSPVCTWPGTSPAPGGSGQTVSLGRLGSAGLGRVQDVVGVDDAVGVALLGQEPLPVRGEVRRRRCRGRPPCRSARCARRPSAAAPGRAAGPPPGGSRTCRTPGWRRWPRAGRSRSSRPWTPRAGRSRRCGTPRTASAARRRVVSPGDHGRRPAARPSSSSWSRYWPITRVGSPAVLGAPAPRTTGVLAVAVRRASR